MGKKTKNGGLEVVAMRRVSRTQINARFLYGRYMPARITATAHRYLIPGQRQ